MNENTRIRDLALRDPVRCYMELLGIQARPVVLNTSVSFSTFTLNQAPIAQPLDQQVTRRTWVDNLTYTLSVPNAFVGNIFQPDAMAKLKSSTGITIRQTIMSGPRFLISDTYTPLENYVNQWASRWPSGWQIYADQQVLSEFILTAVPFNDPSNTPPYNAVVTFNGWQFDTMDCEDMTKEEAYEGLQQLGIGTMKSLGGRQVFCPSC